MKQQEDLKDYSIIDPSYIDKYEDRSKGWSVTIRDEHKRGCHELWRDICNLVADLQLLDEVQVGQPNFGRPMHVNIKATKHAKELMEKNAPFLQICKSKWLEPHKPRHQRRLG